MLDGLRDGTLGLPQRSVGRGWNVGQGAAERSREERVGRFVQREGTRFAAPAHDTARGAAEPGEVIGLPTGRAGGEVRGQAPGEQQLEAERELVGVRGRGRSAGVGPGTAIQQCELVAEQVVDRRVGLRRVEQPGDSVAGACGGVQGGAVLPEATVRVQRLRAGDRHQVAATFVQHEIDATERLEPTAEPTPGAPYAFGDGPDSPTTGREQVQDAVGLAVADRPQDDRLGLDGSRHQLSSTRRRPGAPAILCEVMSPITVYTTNRCPSCFQVKRLLDKRGLSFNEINLARDPEGRTALVEKTGRMSFPQVLIGDTVVGGFEETVRAERSGHLAQLLTQAA